jgi:hypothetical protein
LSPSILDHEFTIEDGFKNAFELTDAEVVKINEAIKCFASNIVQKEILHRTLGNDVGGQCYRIAPYKGYEDLAASFENAVGRIIADKTKAETIARIVSSSRHFGAHGQYEETVTIREDVDTKRTTIERGGYGGPGSRGFSRVLLTDKLILNRYPGFFQVAE